MCFQKKKSSGKTTADFSFLTNAHQGSMKHPKNDQILVDCGATCHLLNRSEHFTVFDKSFDLYDILFSLFSISRSLFSELPHPGCHFSRTTTDRHKHRLSSLTRIPNEVFVNFYVDAANKGVSLIRSDFIERN